jgi:hypothetical protein
MSIELNWGVEERVIFVRFQGGVTLVNLEETVARTVELLNQNDHPPAVHLIADIRGLKSYPSRVLQIIEAITPTMTHPRLGQVVLSGPLDETLSFYLELAEHVFRTSIVHVANPEKGLEHLCIDDDGLDQRPFNFRLGNALA